MDGVHEEQTGDHFRDLMHRIREGSEEAAWELVDQYGSAIRRAVRRSLSDKLRSKFDSLDFVQVVWHSFFRVRDKTDRFGRPEELAAYLVTMARNKVGMETRRRLATEKYDVDREQPLNHIQSKGCPDDSGNQPEPINVAIAREQWDRILKGQPEHCRKIVQLRLQGYTIQRIAEVVQVDESTVRRFLKKLLHTAVA